MPNSKFNVKFKTITGWALAVTCYISHSIGKRPLLTRRGAETPESISVKLEIYDFVWDPPHAKFGEGSSGQIGSLPHLLVSFLSLFFCFLRHAYKLGVRQNTNHHNTTGK